LAREEGVSVNQFVMLAVAEKVAAIITIEYLEKRAKRVVARNCWQCWIKSRMLSLKNTTGYNGYHILQANSSGGFFLEYDLSFVSQN
jgi:hypothetical protein